MPVVGTQQSPILVVREDTIWANFPGQTLDVRYVKGVHDGEFDVFENNFVFKAPYQTLVVDGQPWDLRKIHIHRHAEHLLTEYRRDEPRPSDFEVHLVHLKAGEHSGPKVVLGAFFHKQKDAETPEGFLRLDEALRTARKDGQGRQRYMKLGVDPLDFLPPDRSRWYRYEGSLTSGTFSEDVSWFLFPNEFGIDLDKIKTLAVNAEQHPRPVFSLDRRFVLGVTTDFARRRVATGV